MDILVVNCGSSSLKAAVVDPDSGEVRAEEKVERIGDEVPDHATALKAVIDRLDDHPIDAVGHRVVHGGEAFTRPTAVDDALVSALEALIPLAPLHVPANLAGIRAAVEALPDTPQVAVFDTAFHSTMTGRAKTYALPREMAERHGIRRYGFHGPSHKIVARRTAEHLGTDLRDLRVITCHLGNGASVCAVEYGRSADTSMGMTPLEGLVMGTRSGDVDPGALIALARAEGLDLDELDRVLNRESGLAGLSGIGNDMRDIEAKAAEGDVACRTAIHVFTHRLRKYIGAYAAVMGGVDAIAFTGGIGENSALIRHGAAQRLEFLGARLDEDANRDASVDREHPVAEIGTSHGRCRLLVVRTDEALSIARDVADEVRAARKLEADKAIPMAVSARHVHLTREAIDALFGEGHELTPLKWLAQPGQFATEETVTLIGPKRTMEGVRIIGPERSRNQVEIARTDEFFLGIDAPIRCSGDLDNTPGITLEGPRGRYTLDSGVIQAQRHIHMTSEDAEHFGVSHKEIVEVHVDSDGRDLIFGDVVVRVKDSYRLEMHVDTDEGNAAEVVRGHQAVLFPTRDSVRLVRRGREG